MAEEAGAFGDGFTPVGDMVEAAHGENDIVSMGGERNGFGAGGNDVIGNGERGEAAAGEVDLGEVDINSRNTGRIVVGGEVVEAAAVAAADFQNMSLSRDGGDAAQEPEFKRPLDIMANGAVDVEAFPKTQFHCSADSLVGLLGQLGLHRAGQAWCFQLGYARVQRVSMGVLMIRLWKISALSRFAAGLGVTVMMIGVGGMASVQAADVNGVVSETAVGFETAKIEEIVTPKGLTAWLIRAPNLPMVSVEINFRSGAMLEPKDKQGVAHFTAALMDEGAGPYDARQFREELDAIGARFGASTDTQDLSVNLTTLTEHKKRAFELLGLALNKPRFDADAVERMRDGMMADIRQGDEEPSSVAWRLFRPAIYGEHAYANSGEGTLETVGGLSAEDAKAWHAGFTKANMMVAVIGDITPEDLSALLDGALGDLPAGDARATMTVAPTFVAPTIIRKQMDVPQGTVLLGQLGLPRTDPDFYAMLVMNEILGGGVLTSRLGADVREKHGLAYGVNSANAPLPYAGMFYVSLATGNDTVAKALELVRKHLNLIRDTEVTKEEFDDAKAYLVGSFPLRLDSNAKLLNMMAMMQSENLPRSYLNDWPKKIATVTRVDIQRVAKKLIQPKDMTLVVVGQGKALDAQ